MNKKMRQCIDVRIMKSVKENRMNYYLKIEILNSEIINKNWLDNTKQRTKLKNNERFQR